MIRIEIKNKAKSVSAVNRRLFSQILILYFCVLLFSLLLTHIGYMVINIRFLLDLSPEWLISLPTTPYTQAIVKVLSTLLSAPIFLLLYKIIYFSPDNKDDKIDFHKAMLSIKDKDFLIKALALGIIMCVFTVPFEMLSNITNLYTKMHEPDFPWPQYILIPLIFSAISFVLSFLVELLYCIGALYPEKSVIWITIKSVKVILKNFFDYIVFVLSFLPWFLIELAGVILLAIFAKNFEDTYTLSAMALVVVSPIMMGIGFYFWPYFNAAKAIFCKELISNPPSLSDGGLPRF